MPPPFPCLGFWSAPLNVHWLVDGSNWRAGHDGKCSFKERVQPVAGSGDKDGRNYNPRFSPKFVTLLGQQPSSDASVSNSEYAINDRSIL